MKTIIALTFFGILTYAIADDTLAPEHETDDSKKLEGETSDDQSSTDKNPEEQTLTDKFSGDKELEPERGNENKEPKDEHEPPEDEKSHEDEQLENLEDEASEDESHEGKTSEDQNPTDKTLNDETPHEDRTHKSEIPEAETLKEEKHENEKHENGTLEDEETLKNETLKYGTGTCQYLKYKKDFDGSKFFNGTWYLTHATSSVRVNGSTICRDYVTTTKGTGNNRFYSVSYGYNKNGEDGNHNDVQCSGIQNEFSKEQYNFVCFFKSGGTQMEVDAYFLETDYEKIALVYRCITVGTHFEDNFFVLYRNKNPSDDEVNNILERSGLKSSDVISRKGAACETK